MTQQRTFDSSTIREELGDEIYILSPMDTPLLSLLEHETVRQQTFEWLMDEVEEPTAVNAQLEGFTVGDSSDVKAANRTRVRAQNITMVDALAVHVSHAQRLTNEAGVEDEYSYQVALKGLELLKRQDYNLHWSEYTAGATGEARMTAGILEWLQASGGIVTPTANPNATAGDYTIAGNTISTSKMTSRFWYNTGANMTETQFNQLMQNAWDNGMDIGAAILFCGGNVKRHISDFGNVYSGTASPTNLSAQRRNINAAEVRKIMPIDFYQSDFGEIGMALDRRLQSSTAVTFESLQGISGAQTGMTGLDISAITNVATARGPIAITPNETFFAVDPAFHCVAVFQPFYYEEIGRRGNSTEGYVTLEIGYKPKNPIGMFGGVLSSAGVSA